MQKMHEHFGEGFPATQCRGIPRPPHQNHQNDSPGYSLSEYCCVSFIRVEFVEILKPEHPKVLILRGTDLHNSTYFGISLQLVLAV